MTYLIAMPGGPELIIIFFAILLLFGGKGIPKLMRGLGQGIGEWKKAKLEMEKDIQDAQKVLENG